MSITKVLQVKYDQFICVTVSFVGGECKNDAKILDSL